MKYDWQLSIPAKTGKFVSKSTRLFTVGSCFAQELRKALRIEGYPVTPENERWDSLFAYNTFTIYYEFARAFGLFSTNYADCWKNSSCRNIDTTWQEPSRRGVFGQTKKRLRLNSKAIDSFASVAVREAEVVVITLGLSEAWKSLDTGLIACAHPKYGAAKRGYVSGGCSKFAFHNITEEENYTNLKLILTMLRGYSTDNCPKVILTVSPIPLRATFSGVSCKKANEESKRKLYAPARTLAVEFPSVYYFDSFDFCMKMPTDKLYARGGTARHLERDVVSRIMSRFSEQFGTKI